MKYLKSFMIYLAIFTILFLIISNLSYFDILSQQNCNILNILSLIISSLISGIYTGLKSTNKGYLEGMKIGSIIILFISLLSYLGFNNSFNFVTFICYLFIFIIIIIGSIIVINKRKKEK